jgi:hypothetical protein
MFAQAQVGALDSLYTNGHGFNNTVMGGVVLPDSIIIVYGNFTRCNERPVNRVAALNQDGSNWSSFNPGTGPNAQVNTAVVQADGRIILCGQFTQYNGVTVEDIIRIFPNGNLDTSYHASVNSHVNAAYLQSNGLDRPYLYHTRYTFNQRNRFHGCHY